jgi:hypothetical protein
VVGLHQWVAAVALVVVVWVEVGEQVGELVIIGLHC